MRHFSEARREVEKYFLEDSSVRNQIEGACLIWDLQGRLRLMLRLPEGTDAESVRIQVQPKMATSAAPFWTSDIWMWLQDSPETERAVYGRAWREARTLHQGPPEIRVLERHISKESWFAPGIQPPWPLLEQTPPILSFYSFKGGVGRTTALLSLAIQLARAGRRVAVVDLDLEAPGVMSAMPPSDGIEPPCGVLDYLLEKPLVSSDSDIDLSDFYYSIDDSKVISAGPPITVVPAGRLDSYYLQKLARLDYARLYGSPSEAESSVSPLIDLLRALRNQRRADYLLIDSRAGLNDIGGLALSGMSHLDLIFGLNSEQSWKGLQLVARFLGRDRVEMGLAQLDCLIVHALAPEPGPAREADVKAFKEKAYDLFSLEYYDEEGSGGEWPLPDPDAAEQPHYPAVVGFDAKVQRYQRITDVAGYLAEGDFRSLADQVLARIGRSSP